MDWIERYVRDIGRRLPKELSEDVENELRSSLEDALEDCRKLEPASSKETLTFELLRGMGAPAEVAASYQPETYLIGPALYPHFVTALRVILGIVLALLVVEVGFSLLRADFDAADFARAMGGLVNSAIDASLGILGVLVVIFGLVERFGSGDKSTELAWDPKSLPQVDDPDRAGRTGLVIGTAAAIFGLLALNVYPAKFAGSLSFGDEQWLVLVPPFGPGFWNELPLLDVVLGMIVALNLVVLKEGRWRALTRWLDFGITLVFLFWLSRIFVAGPIASPTELELLDLGLSENASSSYVETVLPMMRRLVRYGIWAALVGTTIAGFVELKKAIRATSAK